MRVFVFLTGLVAAAAAASNETRYFYLHVNLFRSDPKGYAARFGREVACDAAPARILFPTECLEEASAYQSGSVARASCPISHQTCPTDCARFGGCGYIERLTHFCPSATGTTEVLGQGLRHARRVLGLFLASPGHCANLNNPSVDSIGASLARVDRNVFVADLAFTNRTSLPAFATVWCDSGERSCTASTTLVSETSLWAWFSGGGNRTLASPWFAPGFFRAENVGQAATEVWFTTLDGRHASPRYPIS